MLSRREKLFLFAGAGAVIIFIYYVFFLMPLLNEFNELHRVSSEESHRALKKEYLVEQITELNKQFEEYDCCFAAKYGQIHDKRNDYAFMLFMEDSMSSIGINYDMFYKETMNLQQLQVVKFHVTMKTAFWQLAELLDSLENSACVSLIDSMEIYIIEDENNYELNKCEEAARRGMFCSTGNRIVKADIIIGFCIIK